MKIIKLAISLIFSLSMLVFSCTKATDNNTNNTNQQTTTPSIKKNQSFQYNFGVIGIEDGISISQQARNFNISSLSRDNTGKMIYNYKPSLNYVGTDEVEITLNISNGASFVNTVKTTIKITITN